MENKLKAAAPAYAAKNWPVFPLVEKQKIPLQPGGFNNATTDPDTIKAWWSRWPNANIGIPACDDTFCVVDIDPEHEGDINFKALCEENGGAPLTLMQETGSGGVHSKS